MTRWGTANTRFHASVVAGPNGALTSLYTSLGHWGQFLQLHCLDCASGSASALCSAVSSASPLGSLTIDISWSAPQNLACRNAFPF
jgi:hypothetical protein